MKSGTSGALCGRDCYTTSDWKYGAFCPSCNIFISMIVADGDSCPHCNKAGYFMNYSFDPTNCPWKRECKGESHVSHN